MKCELPGKFWKWFERNQARLKKKYPGAVTDEQLVKSAYEEWGQR